MKALRQLSCLLLAAGALVGAAEAQERSVVFIHGLKSGPDVWEGAAGRLQQKLMMRPVRPMLDWRATYAQQGGSLLASPTMAGLPSNTVAVGHSNGGIVARQWSRGRSLAGVVTLGSPNQGAPIVARFSEWASFALSTSSYTAHVAGAFNRPSSTSWVGYHVSQLLGMALNYTGAMVYDLVATLGLNAAVPVFADMRPGSAYLQQLNAASNLAREARVLPGRAGIVSIAHNFYHGGPFRAIAPDHADALAEAFYGVITGLEFWGSWIIANAPHGDTAAIQQAQALFSLAGHLRMVDPIYCAMVSSPSGLECLPNDGVLPHTTQRYPGALNIVLGTNGTWGPAHGRQTQQSDDALQHVLVNVMRIAPRTAPPAPPPAPPPSSPPPPSPGPNPDPPLPTPDPSRTDVMLIGDVMRGGDRVVSQNGRYVFVYQGDGNLVLYGDGSPLWHSATHGTVPGYVMLQHDGNFVLYDASQRPLWQTGGATIGHTDAWLLVQNDGNVVIYTGGGVPLWQTGTAR